MATLTASGVVFGDGTTINGTSNLQVGAIMQLYNFNRTIVAIPGGTNIPSSSLGYITNASVAKNQGLANGFVCQRQGNHTAPGAGNNGQADTAAAPGSWRAVTGTRQSVYDGCTDQTSAYPGLFVRVA